MMSTFQVAAAVFCVVVVVAMLAWLMSKEVEKGDEDDEL
jgi:hypothetical protein